MAAALENDLDGLMNELFLGKLIFDIGCQFYAKPTHIVDPHDFYLIPYDYLSYLPALNKAGRRFEIDELEVNACVILQSHKPDVNKYLKPFVTNEIRGTIQKIDKNRNCVIHATDLGFYEENVPIERLFHPLHRESSVIQPLVQHCELHSCAPKGPTYDEKAISAFKFYMGNEKLSVVVKGQIMDKLKVTVYNSNPDDMSTLLVLTNFTYLSPYTKPTPVKPEPIQEHMFSHIDLKKSDTIEIRVQSGTDLNSFYVTPLKTYKSYLDNRVSFTNYCKSEPVIKEVDFKQGTCVGVKDETNDFYERAMILRLNEDNTKALVKLVDWGSEIEVPREKLKFIKSKAYTAAPVSAIFCRVVEGFKPWNNGLPRFLYKGYIFNVTFKRIGAGFRSPHIVLPTRVE